MLDGDESSQPTSDDSLSAERSLPTPEASPERRRLVPSSSVSRLTLQATLGDSKDPLARNVGSWGYTNGLNGPSTSPSKHKIYNDR